MKGGDVINGGADRNFNLVNDNPVNLATASLEWISLNPTTMHPEFVADFVARAAARSTAPPRAPS